MKLLYRMERAQHACRKYNFPYIEAEEYFPDVYTLEMLPYIKSWRTEEKIKMLADSLNHINTIMKPHNKILFCYP